MTDYTDAEVEAKIDEVDAILLAKVATKLDTNWRFDGFEWDILPSLADSRLPIVVNCHFSHVDLSGYDANYQFGVSGLYVATDWLKELGLLDGSVDFRANEDMDNLIEF